MLWQGKCHKKVGSPLTTWAMPANFPRELPVPVPNVVERWSGQPQMRGSKLYLSFHVQTPLTLSPQRAHGAIGMETLTLHTDILVTSASSVCFIMQPWAREALRAEAGASRSL